MRGNAHVPERPLRKNLAYDTERQLYYAVFRENGQRHTRTFRTREEARAALADRSGAGGRLPARGCTLEVWLNFWLREVAARDRAASTLYAYRNMARCHVIPALGQTPLADLSPLQIQSYLYEQMDQGLSPNTVIKHGALLATALGLAVRLELLERNPMERVTLPKKREAPIRFYSPEQLQALFAAVEGSYLELPVKLAAYLGLRRSEICGLRWENVDLEAGVLSIREVRTEVGGEEVLKPPKTRTSARRLGIAGSRTCSAYWAGPGSSGAATTPGSGWSWDRNGRPPMPDKLTQDVKALVRRSHLPRISLHGLRHSFASVANSQGVPMFDISRTLGHSSMAVTSNIYTHLFDDTETHTLEVVAKAIEKRLTLHRFNRTALFDLILLCQSGICEIPRPGGTGGEGAVDPMKIAIVDLGSNTIRLSVYNTLPDGGFELLFSEKEMAGLVSYVHGGVLSPEGIQRACQGIRDFQTLLRQFGLGDAPRVRHRVPAEHPQHGGGGGPDP